MTLHVDKVIFCSCLPGTHVMRCWLISCQACLFAVARRFPRNVFSFDPHMETSGCRRARLERRFFRRQRPGRSKARRCHHPAKRGAGQRPGVARCLLHGDARDADEYRADRAHRLAASLQGRDREILLAGPPEQRPSLAGRLRRRPALPADRHQRPASREQDHVEQRVPPDQH